MIPWLLGTRIGRALSAALAAVAAVWAVYALGKREGATGERRRAQEADHEQADAIRDRIDRNLDQRVRELDDAGYRD